MGKKRKREDSIERKIRKLQKKLHKKRRRLISTSEDESDCPRDPPDASSAPEDYLPALSPVPTPTPLAEIPSSLPAEPPPESEETLDVAGTKEVTSKESNDINLDDETLQLLGEAPEPETIFGKAVHKDITSRWEVILKKGLSKECKEKVFKDYLIPLNCPLLVPPILNPEAKAALTDNFLKRDASMVSRQKHLGIALAILTQTIDKVISNKELQPLKNDVLKPLSDASRILCDMYHYETETRKKFVISSINSELKDTLVTSKTDKFLFGEDMSEKLKVAKTVQRSGESLKVTHRTVGQSNTRTNINSYNKNRGNFRALHLKRPDAGKIQTGPRQQLSYARGRPANCLTQPAPPPPPPPPAPPLPARNRTYRR